MKLHDLKGVVLNGSIRKGPAKPAPQTFAAPSPKATRQKKAKVLTAEERAAFLASRPDLNSKG